MIFYFQGSKPSKIIMEETKHGACHSPVPDIYNANVLYYVIFKGHILWSVRISLFLIIKQA